MHAVENVLKNKEHFDQLFADTDVDAIIWKVKNLNEFLNDAMLTDTSWHGMYMGGFAGRVRGKRILELGCGDGTNALVMASLGAEVTALDISENSKLLIDCAGERLGLSVRTICGDFLVLEFDNRSFDFIVGKSFLHHLTHDLESACLCRVAALLKTEGEARFFEPAVNSKFLDNLRFAVPVPRRPSSLNRRAFKAWKESDPHPERDNSTAHYLSSGRRFFEEAEATFIGSIERLERVIPDGKFNRGFRRWAHRVDPLLPTWFRRVAARSQLLVYRRPRA